MGVLKVKTEEGFVPAGGGGGSGEAGADGFSPIATVTQTASGAVISVTDKSGTTTATVFNGKDGKDGYTPVKGVDYFDGAPGAAGKDGTSVTVKSVSESTADGGNNVVTFSDGKTLTVKNGSKGSTGATGSQGPKGDTGADGYTPVRGVDYFTEADKVEIVQRVIESLGGNPIFGIVDENNNIVVSGDLPDGTYSVKYEMENGTKLNIGNLVIDTNVYYTVTNTLTQCTTNNSATKAVQGGSYSATITAKSGYELSSVKVTMGGTDVSSSAVSGGTISIAEVTGDIVITAVATEVVVTPTYTNLADPTSADWKEGYRLDGSGNPKEDSSVTGLVMTNFISCASGNEIRIKGVTLGGSGHRIAAYASNKACYLAAVPSFPTDDATWKIVNEGNGVYNVTIKNASVAYIRFSGILTGTSADVIITKNEAIG